MPRPSDYRNSKGFTLAQLQTLSGDYLIDYKQQYKHAPCVIVSLGREVYDLTNYLYLHPGQANILESCAGQEIDHIFEDGNHRLLDIERALASKRIHYLGILLDGKAKPHNEDLEAELKSRLSLCAGAPVARQLGLFGLLAGIVASYSGAAVSTPLDEEAPSMSVNSASVG